MPGISSVRKARGVTRSRLPMCVWVVPPGLIADAATGSSPLGWKSGWEIARRRARAGR